MSVTKLENVNMTTVVDVDREKSRCSCLDCDSIGCFLKRYKKDQKRCDCDICRNLRECAPIPRKLSQENQVAKQDNATKKIIREVVTRETIESLKRVTETMYEFGNHENFQMAMDRQAKLDNNVAKPMHTKSDLTMDNAYKDKDKAIDKKVCCRTQKEKTDTRDSSKQINKAVSTVVSKPQKEKFYNKECCSQNSISPVPDENLNVSQNGITTATKLSAQVMNVPYDKLRESIPSTNDITEQNPISKLNIFRRIKEIYEACTCKVCECISSKPLSLQNEFCKCKPCDCQDCANLRKNIEEKVQHIPHSGCPCIRCDRKDCRGIAKDSVEQQMCDCSPSDNLQNTENLLKPCNCEPCECINCKTVLSRPLKTVTLGPVDEFIQHGTCQCSPCECVECKQIYNRTNPTIMACTQMGRYRNYCRCDNCRVTGCHLGEIETCKCETFNRETGHLFQKYNNYDIRPVFVDNRPTSAQEHNIFKNQDTIALFASVRKEYPRDSCHKDVCKCFDCECIVCPARDNAVNKDILMSNVRLIKNETVLPMSIMNACKCVPCECEVCSKRSEGEFTKKFQSSCRCDVCDCLNCDNILALASCSVDESKKLDGRKPSKQMQFKEINGNCKCNPCVCSNCRKLFSCSSSVKFYSNGKRVASKTSRRLKKVMLITPTTSQTRLNKQKLHCKSQQSAISPKNSMDGLFQQDLSTCHALSYNNYAPISDLPHVPNDQDCQLNKKGNDHKLISNNDVVTDLLLLERASFTSVEDKPSNTYEIRKEPNKVTREHLNEPPVKINNAKDESLPVFWACCNGTSYPSNFSGSIKISSKESKCRSKSSLCVKNQQEKQESCKSQEKQAYSNVKDKTNSLASDVHTEYFIHPHSGTIPMFKDRYQESSKNNCFNNYFLKNNKLNRRSDVNYSDITKDYDRTVKVLYEARAFSSKLVKLLDSFEQANNEFESASEKLKNLHSSLMDINKDELNKDHNLRTEHKEYTVHDATFENISEIHHDNGVNIKNENQAEKEYEYSGKMLNYSYYTEELVPITEISKQSTNLNIQKNETHTVHIYDTNILKESEVTQKYEDTAPHKSTETWPENGKTPLSDVNNSNDFEYRQAYVSNISKEEIKKNVVTEESSHILGSMHNIHRLQLSPTALATTFTETENVSNRFEEQTKQEDQIPWDIFKKNLFIHATQDYKRINFRCPTLELDIKEAIQAISRQGVNNEIYNKNQRTNEALANLQSEVNDLLNMPLLQPSLKHKLKTETLAESEFKPIGVHSKLNLDIKSMSSTASSQTCDRVSKSDKEVYFNFNAEGNKAFCDDLKTKFVGLRRVSDHTVLVKWRVPRRVQDVQGYELLVDGRAVQKIFSPTRSMAVVTCLPHAERVLLTVRTIADADCGHAPASTIVYRPRMK